MLSDERIKEIEIMRWDKSGQYEIYFGGIIDNLLTERKLLVAIANEVKFFDHQPHCNGGYECKCQLKPVGTMLAAWQKQHSE